MKNFKNPRSNLKTHERSIVNFLCSIRAKLLSSLLLTNWDIAFHLKLSGVPLHHKHPIISRYICLIEISRHQFPTTWIFQTMQEISICQFKGTLYSEILFHLLKRLLRCYTFVQPVGCHAVCLTLLKTSDISTMHW